MNRDYKNHILILSRSNHEQWLRKMKLRLEAKGIFYTKEMSMQAIAWNAKLVDTESLGGTEGKASTLQKFDGSCGDDKKFQYKRNQPRLQSILYDHIPEDDQSIIDELVSAILVWARLKKKYEKTSITAINSHLGLIQNFHYNGADSIDTAWAK